MIKQTIIIFIFFVAATRSTIQFQFQQNLSIQQQVNCQIDNCLNNVSKSKSKSSSNSSSGGAIFCFILGPVLFISSFSIIWYNQKRAAIQYRRLTMSKSICNQVDIYQSPSLSHGRLININGKTITNRNIQDILSGVGGNGLLKIIRKVQVLQWRKKTKGKDDEKQIYYQLEWSESNSQVQGQKFNSPINWFINSTTVYNQEVYIGPYSITKQVIDLCHKDIGYVPNQTNITNIINHSSNPSLHGFVKDKYIYFNSSHQGYVPPTFDNLQSNIYQSQPNSDGPGTLRVMFLLCPIGDISIVGKSYVSQSKAQVVSFNMAAYEGTQQQKNQIPESVCCMLCNAYKHLLAPLQNLLLVKEQIQSKDDMFITAIKQSQLKTSLVRLGAYICMVLGICLFLSPITTILGYIPLVGGFVSGIVGFAIFLGAVLLCIPLFIIAMSIAWIFYHPRYGIVIFLLGLGIMFLMSLNKQNQLPNK